MDRNPPEPKPASAKKRHQIDLPPGFLICSALLLLSFAIPLYRWLRFALENDLYSYTLLVPFVCTYLVATGTKRINDGRAYPGFRIAGFLAVVLGLLATGWLLFPGNPSALLQAQDAAALGILAFVLLFTGISVLTLPVATLRRAAFPLGFLFFMVPFPVALEHGIESLLQHGSAPPAYWLFQFVGTPLLREGLVFHLPGISIQIAPECSGIRSTLVLFMTSILAGHLFLRSTWRRVALTAFVLPLALLRNGIRVFTIGQLCVSVGPHMIDSPIHHRGGPIFFALSLIPFFILVFFLMRADRRLPNRFLT